MTHTSTEAPGSDVLVLSKSVGTIMRFTDNPGFSQREDGSLEIFKNAETEAVFDRGEWGFVRRVAVGAQAW